MARMSQATIDAHRVANGVRAKTLHTLNDIPPRQWSAGLVATIKADDSPTLIETLLAQIETDNTDIDALENP